MKHFYLLPKNILTPFIWYNWITVIVFGILALPIFGQQLKINSGAYFINSGAVYIKINNADIVNNGIYTKGIETVTLSGNTARTISGTSDIDLYNISVTNTGGISTLLSQLTVNNLVIASGSKFYIDTTRAVTTNGLLTNSAGLGGLVIKSNPLAANGTLIFHNAVGSPVQATVEMYTKASKPSTSSKWQFFGIPLRTMTAYPTFNGSYVRQMYENVVGITNRWIQLQNASTLNSFTGYEITQVTPKTIYFQGELENSDYSSGQLTYTATASYIGQHLIGNPYTAAININPSNGTAPTFGAGMDATIYLYSTGSLSDWTSNSGSGSNAGQYLSVPQATAGYSGLPSTIPSMQGFLVKINAAGIGATLNIPYGAVVKNKSETNEMLRARAVGKVCTLIDVKGTSSGDRMWIFSEPSCTHGFNNGWDGVKMFSSVPSPQIYAMEVDGNYQVNSVDDINNTYLGFKAGGDTNYTLTFTQDNISTRYNAIYLLDIQENITTDITQSGTVYSFTASNTTTPVKRFKIVTSPETITGGVGVKTGLRIFSSQQTIFVHNTSSLKGDLILYDITGRVKQKWHFNANGITTLQLNLPVGFYIAKGFAGSETVTENFIIR